MALNLIFRSGVSKLACNTRAFSAPAANAAYQTILVEKKGVKQNVGVVTLNRPKLLNALSPELINELVDVIKSLDKDDSVSAIVLTGSEKAFAAGADIKQMKNRSYSENVSEGFIESWAEISKCRKPLIAAVNGYCLGGGCELAMSCDIIYAGEKAKFGQPEIAIGTIPGAGGTQRIARSCGKSKAMEICLTGDQFTAQEAEKIGLVSKVFPPEKVIDEAVKLGEKIGNHSPLIVKLCKESVNVAFETSLQEGLRFEKKIFHATFATEDQKEGMAAFTEKRKPVFKNK